MCCDGKPVKLNHLNKGEKHLADDIIPIDQDRSIFATFDTIKKKIIIGRSTRTFNLIEIEEV